MTDDLIYEIAQRVTAYASDLRPEDAAEDLRDGFGDRIVDRRELAGWIPASEKLPEEKVEVLVCAPHGRYLAWRRKSGEWLRDGTKDEWFRVIGVTHWMPLPSPPEALSESD